MIGLFQFAERTSTKRIDRLAHSGDDQRPLRPAQCSSSQHPDSQAQRRSALTGRTAAWTMSAGCRQWAASNAGVGPNVVIIAALPQGGFEPKVINAAGRTIDRNQ